MREPVLKATQEIVDLRERTIPEGMTLITLVVESSVRVGVGYVDRGGRQKAWYDFDVFLRAIAGATVGVMHEYGFNPE